MGKEADVGREQIDAGEDSRTARVNDGGKEGWCWFGRSKGTWEFEYFSLRQRLVLDRDNLEEKERERRHIEKIRLKSTIKHPKRPTTT